MAEKVLILGAGFLGINTALELLETDREITLIDQDLRHEYTPGTIDLIRDRVSEKDLIIDVEEFFEDEDVEIVEGKIVDVRPDEEVVETQKGLHGYDELVLGLGGKPRNFGVDISDAYSVWSIEEAEKLAEELEDAEEAVVVGSGYTGLETAGEIAERGVKTIVVESKTRPAPGLSEKSSKILLEIMQEEGIDFRGGRTVRKVEEDGVELEEDGRIEADIVVWCGGVEASEVVEESFNAESAGLDVNKGLSAKNYGGIFAGGDDADTGSLKTAHNAMTQADIIAENIQRGDKPLKQFDSDTSPLAVSIGDRGAIVHKQKVVWTGFPSRRIKDLVRKYYFWRLKWKKLKPKYL